MRLEYLDWKVKDDDTAKVFRVIDEEREGYMIGCYSDEVNRIFIWAVYSKRGGFLKNAMDMVCKRFNCTDVEFTNIITDMLLRRLRGFRPVIRRFKGMEIICLVGRWEVIS